MLVKSNTAENCVWSRPQAGKHPPASVIEIEFLFRAMDGSPDTIFVTDRQNRIVAWNLAAERLLGYSADEALGAPCAALLEGCDVWGNRYCSENCPIRDMALRAESVRRFNLNFRANDRGTVTAELTILHLSNASHDHFYLAHILKASDRVVYAPETVDSSENAPKAALTAARDSADARARRLTPREVEILGLLASGRMTGDIASLLHLSTLTVRNHIQNILDKLEVHSKAEAVAFAFQKRLV